MKSLPLVSVIIPVYNVAPYLREAVNSVIDQTYKKLEIILIDDESTDGSGAICDEYLTDHRVVVLHQKHRGVGAARNAGLNAATGDYISFLDPDDAYHPSFIHKMMKAMFRKQVDIVVCGYIFFHTTGRMKGYGIKRPPVYQSRGTGDGVIFDRIEGMRAVVDERIDHCVWNKLYKKKLWDHVRFPEAYNRGEDIIASYKVFELSESTCMIDRYLYYHRKRPGSLSDLHTAEALNDLILFFSEREAFIETHVQEVFSEHYIWLCRQSHLGIMMSEFAKAKEIPLAEEIKRQIDDLINKAGSRNCRFRYRIWYGMICLCPGFLRKIYPVYALFRQPVRVITGK